MPARRVGLRAARVVHICGKGVPENAKKLRTKKKGWGRGPTLLGTRTGFLPVHADAEPQDARRDDRLNVVRVVRVLVRPERLDDVPVADVEDVERRDESN